MLGQLVPKAAAGEFHCRQPPLTDEDLHVPVGGGQAERRRDLLAVLKDLIRREWALDVDEQAADCPALTGVSLH